MRLGIVGVRCGFGDPVIARIGPTCQVGGETGRGACKTRRASLCAGPRIDFKRQYNYRCVLIFSQF